MSREMRFGEDAGNEIIKAVRETNRRMRNSEPYRGRWFNRSQPNAGAATETCCCPKCNTDLPVTASCECLPDICVIVYDSDGVIRDELLGTWGSNRFFTGTIVIDDCSIPITVTNGWGGGNPQVPGFRLTSTSWECLGIPECGLFQAITCSQWKTGAEVSVDFSLDLSACLGCDDVGAVTVRLRPKLMYRPKCDGCGCVDEWMCLKLPYGRAARAQQVDGVWNFADLEPFNGGDPYQISVKLEGKSSECSDCVLKLSFPAAGIDYTDEEYWVEEGCTGHEWAAVAYAGTANEAEITYIRVTPSSCEDCVPFTCFPACVCFWNGTDFTYNPLYVSVDYGTGTATGTMTETDGAYAATIDLGACGMLSLSLYCLGYPSELSAILDYALSFPVEDGCSETGIGVALECVDGEAEYSRSFTCVGCTISFTIATNNAGP